jgi:hypothetical protein
MYERVAELLVVALRQQACELLTLRHDDDAAPRHAAEYANKLSREINSM